MRRVEKGQLLEYILTDLRVPHSYEVRLTPYTTFGAGDMASRIIHYTERRWWWGGVGGRVSSSSPRETPPPTSPHGSRAWGSPLCSVQLCHCRLGPSGPRSWFREPCPLVPSLGTLCPVPHLSSDLVFLLAFSAINSPNLSGETPPSHLPFPLGTQRLPWWEERTPRDTQRENGDGGQQLEGEAKGNRAGLGDMCIQDLF